MKGFNQKKFEIEVFTRAYANSKKTIADHVANRRYASPTKLMHSTKIINRVEGAANELNGDNYLIIKSEVLDGKHGKWYAGYYSESTYYRLRDRAYQQFLDLFK